MKNKHFETKLTGVIFPSRHPLIYIAEKALLNLINEIPDNPEETKIRGYILGEFKPENELEITEFSQNQSPGNIIGEWIIETKTKVVLLFKGDEARRFSWDLDKEIIQVSTKNDNDEKNSIPEFKKPFGYFIKEEIDSLVQTDIPETDLPRTKKIKIDRSEFNADRVNSDVTTESQKIKIPVPKSSGSKIKIEKHDINLGIRKLAPFFDDGFTYSLFEENILKTGKTGSLQKLEEGKKNVWRLKQYRNYSFFPYYIFISSDVSDAIKGRASVTKDKIGILQGQVFRDSKLDFQFLEIDNAIYLSEGYNLFFKWEEQILKGIEKNAEHIDNIVGWFFRVSGVNIHKTTKKAKKWHKEVFQKMPNIGILLFKQDGTFDRFDLFSYNPIKNLQRSYERSVCYSYKKKEN